MREMVGETSTAKSDARLLTCVLRTCEQQHISAGLHLVYHYRAVAWFKLARYATAAQDAGAALAIQQSFTPASCCYAAALEALGKSEDAVAVLQRALQLDPADLQAKALLQQINSSRARQTLEAAVKAAAASPATALPSEPPCNASAAAGEPIVTLHAVEGHTSQIKPGSSSPSMYPKAILPHGGFDPSVWPKELKSKGNIPDHVFQASSDGTNTNLLILLHGLGDNPKPYAALAKRMALPQTASLALAGPLVVPETNGGRAWFQAFDEDFELIEPSKGEMRRVSSLAGTVQGLRKLVEQLVKAGWQHQQIHLFGFSQGGSTALELHMHFRGQEALGGCVSIAGAMLEEALWTRRQGKSSSAAAGSTGVADGCGPVLITLGEQDSTTSKASVNGTLDVIRQLPCRGAVRLHVVPGKGHAMVSSEQEMRAIMSFWAETLSSRPPGDDVVEIKVNR